MLKIYYLITHYEIFIGNKQDGMHKVMGGTKVMQKVCTTQQAQQNTNQQGQCVQVSQAMLNSQPTAQIISPLQQSE